MELPKTRVAPKIKSPKLLILYGASKIGKTTKLAELEDCLIIDTEKGTDYVSAMKVQVGNISELINVIKLLKSEEHHYKYIALDTLDNVANWYEMQVAAENKVKTIGDMAYGAGYAIVRERVMKIVQHLKSVCDYIILVGHLKKTLIGTETTVEVNTSSLDLTGKLKNLVMADADAIGLIYRTPDKQPMVSFMTSEELEVGSRCEHLKGRNVPFEWSEIYVD